MECGGLAPLSNYLQLLLNLLYQSGARPPHSIFFFW